MRFLAMVMGDESTEGGVMPTEEELAAMGKFNEELVNAGIMLAGEGLHPTSNGAKVKYAGGKATVVDGPFTEAKELVAGYWLLEAKSRDEVIDWLKRAPFVDAEVQVRQIFEAEDFGDALTPELREQEERLRAKAERNK